MSSGRSPKPAHLTPAVRKIWEELEPTLYVNTPASVVEAFCNQIKTMRDARIEKDGVVVMDGKNNAVEHPAIAIEQRTLKHIAELSKEWSVSE